MGAILTLSLAALGVDPGVEGGMGLVRPDGSPAHAWAFHGAMERQELVDMVGDAVESLRAYGSRACAFEDVHYIGPRPEQGKKGDGGKGAFTFGRVNGLLEGSLRALGVRPRFVTPMMWQAAMECMTGGVKNVSKARAIELFPGLKITHNTADALLIAEYERRRLAF